MMKKYAAGEELTQFLLAMSGLEPCRILDLGAGDGRTVRLLNEQGFFAQGIDETAGENVEAGDVLHCPYADGSFDAVVAEGVCYASGQEQAVWQEAKRLLKTGGMLLLADFCFTDTKGHVQALENAGFQVMHVEDATAVWLDIGCVEDMEEWNRCRYFLSICEKEP